ncbi:MAG: sigma-70 family RNA polymerase sigma factor [Chloroflexi bacterium]|nr:sigma-70 family RNA polymerase sigma factor [Chloroflexota bacterium]
MNNTHIEYLTIRNSTLDRQTVLEVYEHYSQDIFQYASRLLDDLDSAEECVSETFSRFLQFTRGGNWPENVRAYLYRAAHNWIIDNYRHQSFSVLALNDELSYGADGNPAITVQREMDRQRVRNAILKLPAEQRQVIVLRFMQDLSHEEIAAAIGKTIEATRALQYRAVAALRQILVD